MSSQEETTDVASSLVRKRSFEETQTFIFTIKDMEEMIKDYARKKGVIVLQPYEDFTFSDNDHYRHYGRNPRQLTATFSLKNESSNV